MERANYAAERGCKRGRSLATNCHRSQCHRHPHDEHQHVRQQLRHCAHQLLQHCGYAPPPRTTLSESITHLPSQSSVALPLSMSQGLRLLLRLAAQVIVCSAPRQWSLSPLLFCYPVHQFVFVTSFRYGSQYSLLGIPSSTLPQVMHIFAKVLLFEGPNTDFMSFTRHCEQTSSFVGSSLASQLRSLPLHTIANYCCLVLRPQSSSMSSGVREVGVIASYSAAFAREGISVMNLSSTQANYIFFSRADADEATVKRLLQL
jgi:hypothetical protein